MKDTTLNLEASRAIAELGIKLETEKYRDIKGDETYSPSGHPSYSNGLSYGNGLVTNDIVRYTPAPNFGELILALPQIGARLGWGEEICNDCGKYPSEKWCSLEGGHFFIVPTSTYKSHRLLNLFIEGGMEAVSKEIMRLVDEHYHAGMPQM